MADIVPFRSRFDIDGESAVAAALFGPAGSAAPGHAVDGGRARIETRRRRLGLGHRPQYPAGFETDANAAIDCSHISETAQKD